MAGIKRRIEKYNYSDYLTWPDEERWEIIEGTAYDMTPAPGIKHQNVVAALVRIIGNGLEGKPCRPFVAPTDVVLSEHDVVQPDVLVVCDQKRITEDNIQGAPDLVVEVLSPATALKDKREKKALYERSGVREYVIIDPIELYVERFSLKDKRYGEAEIFGPREVLSLKGLEGLKISLWEVFDTEAPGASERGRRPGASQ